MGLGVVALAVDFGVVAFGVVALGVVALGVVTLAAVDLVAYEQNKINTSWIQYTFYESCINDGASFKLFISPSFENSQVYKKSHTPCSKHITALG